MTYEQAIEFFCQYGNVTSDQKRAAQEQPTDQQLEDATNQAIFIKKQHSVKAKEAQEAVKRHWLLRQAGVEET